MKSKLSKRVISFFVSLALAIMMIIGASFTAVPAIEKYTGNTGPTYTVAAAAKVYYAKNSKKYHCSKNCRTLKRSKKIYKTTVKKAKKKGLKKCKVCY
jgi:hypothetical protein